MSDQGVTLPDVYTTGGEVLMGTLRWEMEEQANVERERAQLEYARKQRELELTQAETQVRMEAVRHELEALKQESATLERERQMHQAQRAEAHDEIHRSRRGGPTVTADDGDDGALDAKFPLAATEIE